MGGRKGGGGGSRADTGARKISTNHSVELWEERDDWRGGISEWGGAHGAHLGQGLKFEAIIIQYGYNTGTDKALSG